MSLKLKSKRIENEMLEDLLNSNGEKFKELNDFIIEHFKLNRNEYSDWLYEQDLRVYEGIDYDTVIDAWFYVQHFDSEIEVQNDKFIILPPRGYKDSYKNDKLEYPNTKEGLVEAFFNTIMSEYVCRVEMYGKEYFVCVDEI